MIWRVVMYVRGPAINKPVLPTAFRSRMYTSGVSIYSGVPNIALQKQCNFSPAAGFSIKYLTFNGYVVLRDRFQSIGRALGLVLDRKALVMNDCNQDINAIQSRGTADSFLVIIMVASYLSDSVSLAFLVFNLLCVNSSLWVDRIKLSVAIMN